MTRNDRPRPSDEALRSLLEQGLELQRRYDAIAGSRTWRLQEAVGAALRSPGAALRLPARLWRILRAPPPSPEPAPAVEWPAPRALPADRPAVLALTPWLRVGGAERVVLELVRCLSGDIAIAVAPAEARGAADAEFVAAAPWIFRLDPHDYAGSLARLVRERGFRAVLISSCPQAYAALPRLRAETGVRTADILHNVAPEGSLPASLAQDAHLDLHFAAGRMQAGALARGGVAIEKIVLAPNGVDCRGRFDPAAYPEARAAVRAEFGVPDGAPLLAWLGRLSPEKAPDVFIETLGLLRADGVRGLLIGDGPERFRLEAAIDRLGLRGRAAVTGFTSRAPELLAAADALLLTSRTEGSPLSVLEAMSLGLPVVAANVGAVAEAVADGETGLLVGERSAAAFAAAWRRLAGDPAWARRLGRAGRRRAVDEFSRERMLEAYHAGLARLCAAPVEAGRGACA